MSPDDLLIDSYLDDGPTDEVMARLAPWLREDPARIDLFVHRSIQHYQLRDLLIQSAPVAIENSKLETPNTKNAPSPSRFVFRISSFTLAALFLIAAALYFVFLPSNPPSPNPHPPSPSPASFAILSDLSDDAKFADAEHALGSDLSGPIKLTAGRAQLMFKSTAVVDLTGPCEFHMTGPNRGRLTSGGLSAYVPQKAHGFIVDLPHGASVTDLGTRFGAITDAGHTVVRVYQGRVLVDAGDEHRTLTVGQIARLDAGGRLASVSSRWIASTDQTDVRDQLRMDADLVALYSLNGATASTPSSLTNLSSSGSSLDGVIHGAAIVDGRLPDTRALQFGGANQYVHIAVPEPLESFTCAAWVKLDAEPAAPDHYGVILATDQWHPGCVGMDVAAGRLARFNVFGDPHAQVTSPASAALPLGQWVQIVGTYDPQNGLIRLYLDGALIAFRAIHQSQNITLASARIGNWVPTRVNNLRPFPGVIDQVLIFRRALTQDEVHALYQAEKSQNTQPLEIDTANASH
ncbi:MAG: hypothetical protein GC162_09920 [Planctomycetes bacterium]|nr:hypothetical protein [Planctomycetota bacterium]